MHGRPWHVLESRGWHKILLRLLRHLCNILILLVWHWCSILRIRLRRWGSRLCGIRRLVAVGCASKIHLIQLSSIASESKLHHGTSRTWNFITKDVESLTIDVFTIDDLQNVAWLYATALVSRPAFDQALDIYEHASAPRVDSLPSI